MSAPPRVWHLEPKAAPAGYDDSTAVLSGTWGPNQTVQATVAVTSASSASSVFEEVELRLRTTITANSITGYEVNCGISNKFQLSTDRSMEWTAWIVYVTRWQGLSLCQRGRAKGDHHRQHNNRVLERHSLFIPLQIAHIRAAVRVWGSFSRGPRASMPIMVFRVFPLRTERRGRELYSLGHTFQSDCDAGNERGLYGKCCAVRRLHWHGSPDCQRAAFRCDGYV